MLSLTWQSINVLARVVLWYMLGSLRLVIHKSKSLEVNQAFIYAMLEMNCFQ